LAGERSQLGQLGDQRERGFLAHAPRRLQNRVPFFPGGRVVDQLPDRTLDVVQLGFQKLQVLGGNNKGE
jgi:hypothetical protein